MNHVVPKPSHKMTLLIRDEHRKKCEAIGQEVRARTGEHVSAAFIIDHLIANADMRTLMEELQRKVTR